MKRLAWRLKFRWDCCGGHYIDKKGANNVMEPVAYRFVFCHRKTHEVRYEDRPLTDGQLSFDLWRILGEAVAIGIILASFVALYYWL